MKNRSPNLPSITRTCGQSRIGAAIRTIGFAGLLATWFLGVAALPAWALEAVVVPTVMDNNLDAWYGVPSNAQPIIHRTAQVVRNQPFHLIVAVRDFDRDQRGHAHIRYDVRIIGPDGREAPGGKTGILVRQGPAGGKLVLNREFWRASIHEGYPYGAYTLAVTVHDRVGKRSIERVAVMELVPLGLGKRFRVASEATNWLKAYHLHPEPLQALPALLRLIHLDPAWQRANRETVYFFRQVLADNTYLLDGHQQWQRSATGPERRKIAWIAKLIPHPAAKTIAVGPNGSPTPIPATDAMAFPLTNGGIERAEQVDALWATFMATGRRAPIRKMIDGLALAKHEGSLTRLGAGNPQSGSATLKRHAYLEAIFLNIANRLRENCIQFPLVFNYCAAIYQTEDLPETVRDKLGHILAEAQDTLQHPNTSKSKPN